LTEFRADARRILVVEDDPTNRSVLARQLAVVGVEADMAGNGEDGLSRWLGGGFALVLSDLHMPVMDGFGLVRAIRSREVSGTRTPVLAFSADVRIGQAERAREAGFDDFLAKPMQLDGLRAVLGRWLAAAPIQAGTAAATPGDAPGAGPEAVPAFEIAALRELVGGERGLMLEILGYFDEVATGMRDDLLRAARAGDACGAGMLAHRLKASAHSVGAVPLAVLCARLEEHVDGGRRDGIAPLVEQVVVALDAALAAMRRWRAAAGAPAPDMTRYAL
jgi:CheY-like chemotaxis protein/HPt (histidine-containing phosphotransfer) domain-containing protein